MKKLFNNLLDLLFPSLCIACHTRLKSSELHLCISCLQALPKTSYHLQDENRLEHFLAGKFPFKSAAAFCYFYKTGSLQKIIHELKYKNNPQLAYFMGRLYGRELLNTDFISDIDYLIPIPLHPKRQKQRGYNQAEEICKGISEVTNIPLCTTVIERKVNNPSQTKRTKIERWENVDGIFATTNNPPLRNKHILLVDDVITTGSTIEAIVKSFPKEELPTVSIAAIGIAM